MADYYALAGVAGLFRRPCYGPDLGLAAFRAIAEHLAARTAPPPYGDVPYRPLGADGHGGAFLALASA